MTGEKTMRDAIPHIERASRALEMLRLFADNKDGLSLTKRVPIYYDALADSVLELQRILLTDNEYTERVGRSLEDVSRDRVLSYNVTQADDGAVFYSIEGMLPLRRMKRRVLMNGKAPIHV